MTMGPKTFCVSEVSNVTRARLRGKKDICKAMQTSTTQNNRKKQLNAFLQAVFTKTQVMLIGLPCKVTRQDFITSSSPVHRFN